MLDNLSALDKLSEVTFQGVTNQQLTGPGQLVWLKGDGTERVLYDCPKVDVGQPTCIPYDPRVSFDGKKVAFTVFKGTMIEGDYPVMRKVDATEAQIHIVDLTTLEVTLWPLTPGHFDTAPNWLPDGRILFTSTRAGIYPGPIDGFSPEGVAFQLWAADTDGSNAVNWSPHVMRDVLHPIIHPSGRILYSRWWINKERVNGGTADNIWHVGSVDSFGGSEAAH